MYNYYSYSSNSWYVVYNTGGYNSYYNIPKRIVDKGPGIDENGIPVDHRFVEEDDYSNSYWDEVALYA